MKQTAKITTKETDTVHREHARRIIDMLPAELTTTNRVMTRVTPVADGTAEIAVSYVGGLDIDLRGLLDKALAARDNHRYELEAAMVRRGSGKENRRRRRQ